MRVGDATTAAIDAGVERSHWRALARHEAAQDRAGRAHEALLEEWGGDLEFADYLDSIAPDGAGRI